jgi:hypothetical protein
MSARSYKFIRTPRCHGALRQEGIRPGAIPPSAYDDKFKASASDRSWKRKRKTQYNPDK